MIEAPRVEKWGRWIWDCGRNVFLLNPPLWALRVIYVLALANKRSNIVEYLVAYVRWRFTNIFCSINVFSKFSMFFEQTLQCLVGLPTMCHVHFYALSEVGWPGLVTTYTLSNCWTTAMEHLCISQFQLRPSPPPPPGNCGAFARLVTPGGGALANLAWPGGRAFAYPGATPGLLTGTWFRLAIQTWRILSGKTCSLLQIGWSVKD